MERKCSRVGCIFALKNDFFLPSLKHRNFTRSMGTFLRGGAIKSMLSSDITIGIRMGLSHDGKLKYFYKLKPRDADIFTITGAP